MGEEGAEFTGRTVEAAMEAAEAALGAGRDDLAIEVLTTGSRGVFGIGAEAARILVRRLQPGQATAGVTPEQSPAEELEFEAFDVGPPMEPERADRLDEVLPEEASAVLRQLLGHMGFDASVAVRSEENPVILEITGENLGVLIGRRGDNLSAIQFMVNLILSKGRHHWPRVVIDVENYRSRREDSLRSLAERMAFRVQRNGRPFTLEAMSASDRRIIHLSLRDRSGIETYSIGEGVARRVVIAPKQ